MELTLGVEAMCEGCVGDGCKKCGVKVLFMLNDNRG